MRAKTQTWPLLIAAFGCLLTAPLSAAPDSSGSAKISTSGTDTAPGIADVQAKIDALSGSNKPDPQRTRLLGLYRRTLDDLNAAHGNQDHAAAYAKIATQAPTEIKAVKEQLAALPDLAVQLADLSRTPLDKLESLLTQAQSKLNSLQTRLTDLKAQESAEQPVSLQQSLAQSQSALDQLPAALQSIPEAPAQINTARRDALAAKRLALQTKVQMLQQRLASRDDRLALIHSRNELVSHQVTLTKSRVAALQTTTSRRRQSAADQAVKKAERERARLQNQPGALQRYAQENAELSRRQSKLEDSIAAAAQEESRIQTELNRISQNYNSLTQQLQIAGLSASADFSTLLRQQRDKLEGAAINTKALKNRKHALTNARLKQFRIDQRQDIDVDATTKELLAKANQTKSSGETDIRPVVRSLVTDRQRLLRSLSSAYNREVNAFAELDVEENNLVDKTRQYGRLLDERLFWIPSAAPVSWSTWIDLKRSIAWLFQSAHWRRTMEALSARILPQPALIVLAGLLLGLLLYKRRELQRILTGMKEQVGKVGHDRFGLTLKALFITVLFALPGPLLLSFVGWLFQYPGTFIDVLATGVLKAAALLFLLNIFYHTCRRDGLAEVHFKWSAATLRVMRRNLPWLTLVLIPITIITSFTEGPIIEAYRNSLGRLVFVVASIALAFFAHQVFQPKHGALSHMIAKQSSQWRWQLHYLVYPATVFTPLVLMALALYGYHYTALSVEGKLFISACVIVAGVLVFYLMVRALAVTERRMALRRLRAKRAAARALSESREAVESSGEGVPESLDVPEVDLEAISEHSRALLRLLATLGIATSLWLVWAGLFPALGVLNDITLWHADNVVNGVERASTITLQDLILALLAAFLTVFGARNLPGTLQVVVLGRLSMAPGTSYAITTLCRYTIVILGVIIAFKLVGAQWAKLQWLVAALGVGLGFGLQEIVANFVSGILILFERPIRVGDTVTIGGQTGTVTRIRIRATTVTDWDLKEQIIPNKTFITGELTNWTLSDPTTRLIIKVGVAYGSDIELVHQLLLEIVESNPMATVNPPPSAFFVGFGESSLNFEVRVFVQSVLDVMPLTHELHTTIFHTLKEHGIEIPFPQRDLHIRSSVGAASATEETGTQRKRA